MRKLALVPFLVAALLLVASAGTAVALPAAPTCPSFRVLHDDRIGPAILPAGSYTIAGAAAAGLTCAQASTLFARFLEDYDGVLPKPWTVRAEGRGKASFVRPGAGGFSVSRNSGGEEEGRSPLGALCAGAFTVNAGTRVGPLLFPKGGYLLYRPPNSAIGCRRASILFTRFLGAPAGQLPTPWRVIAQTATFYKPAHPKRSAFRVEPVGGAGAR